MKEVFLIAGRRTPIGSFMGQLSTVSAPQLASVVIKDLLQKHDIKGDSVEEVIMGEVLTSGVGQAPARQATLFSNLPESTPALTINKVCGSGLMALILASLKVMTDERKLLLAGGMENMSLAPHLLPQSRTGVRYGAGKIVDSMQHDGLWDVYSNRTMGECAEECSAKFNFTREKQDEFALKSYQKAITASEDGSFKDEISPVKVEGKKGATIVEKDEEPTKVNFEKMKTLPSAFIKDGTITAANASSINDGAACLIVADESHRQKAQFKVLSFASHAQNPTWFTTAPIEAMKKASEKAKIAMQDIELFEINEAFSNVPMSCVKELEISSNKINIFGGAVALGHPIGCSGARIVVTLMNAMKKKKAKYGMASLCIGGGEGLAMIIENLNY